MILQKETTCWSLLGEKEFNQTFHSKIADTYTKRGVPENWLLNASITCKRICYF